MASMLAQQAIKILLVHAYIPYCTRARTRTRAHKLMIDATARASTHHAAHAPAHMPVRNRSPPYTPTPPTHATPTVHKARLPQLRVHTRLHLRVRGQLEQAPRDAVAAGVQARHDQRANLREQLAAAHGLA